MAQSKVQNIADWTDEAGENLYERGTTVWDKVQDAATALPFAAIGSVAIGVRRVGDTLRSAAAMPARVGRAAVDTPGQLLAATRKAPGQLVEAFEEREEAGREIVQRVTGREAIGAARQQVRSAKKQAKAAGTSISRAARATAKAAEAAAEAALDPRDTRAYEERTREELYELAGDRSIAGRSGMSKKQLIKALRGAR